MGALVAAGGFWLVTNRPRPVAVPVLPLWWWTAVGLGLVAALITPLPLPIGLIGGSLLPIGDVVRRRITQHRLRTQTTERWPDFVAAIRGRIAVGEPLPDAVREAARFVGGRFSDLDRSWGAGFGREIERIRADWMDPAADRVFTTLRLAAVTGGTTVDAVLSALAASLSEDLRMRRAHESAMTQQQLTAAVALLAPWVILALSIATNPQAATEFSTDTGHTIVLMGGVATSLGYLLARRSARLSRPPRLFS